MLKPGPGWPGAALWWICVWICCSWRATEMSVARYRLYGHAATHHVRRHEGSARAAAASARCCSASAEAARLEGGRARAEHAAVVAAGLRLEAHLEAACAARHGRGVLRAGRAGYLDGRRSLISDEAHAASTAATHLQVRGHGRALRPRHAGTQLGAQSAGCGGAADTDTRSRLREAAAAWLLPAHVLGHGEHGRHDADASSGQPGAERRRRRRDARTTEQSACAMGKREMAVVPEGCCAAPSPSASGLG
jgi:hypothetical protein